jgi:tetratricopeptide (TPR) repeat protein
LHNLCVTSGCFLFWIIMKLLHISLFAAILSGLVSCSNQGESPSGNDSLKDSVQTLTTINQKILADPNNLELYHTRARLHLGAKNYEAAINDMDRIIQLDSAKSSWLLTAADVNFFVGKVSKTEVLLKKAVQVDPKNVDCKLRLAQLHHYMKRFDEEVKLLDEVLLQDIHNAQAYFMKGMMFKELGDTTKAISSMQTAVEQEPDYYSAYIQLGLLFAAKNDPLAAQYYQNALRVNPNSEEALYNLGMFFQSVNELNPALDAYTRLLKINPEHFDANFNMGMLHAVKLGSDSKMVTKGMEYFAAAINADPKSPRGYYGRGYCYQRKGDVTNAEADYRKALEVDPQYTNAALALEELGK